jgi:hypothetical protein
MKPLIAMLVAFPLIALAVEYDCTVETKFDGERLYSKEQLRDGQFSVRIQDDGQTAAISRCSFTPSRQKVTCDRYDVDRIAVDEVMDADPALPGQYRKMKIRKYYRFRGQFDVQVFPSLTFVENNGRRGIAYGTCRVVSP